MKQHGPDGVQHWNLDGDQKAEDARAARYPLRSWLAATRKRSLAISRAWVPKSCGRWLRIQGSSDVS